MDARPCTFAEESCSRVKSEKHQIAPLTKLSTGFIAIEKIVGWLKYYPAIKLFICVPQIVRNVPMYLVYDFLADSDATLKTLAT